MRGTPRQRRASPDFGQISRARSQIQGEGEFQAGMHRRHPHAARRVAHAEKARQTAALGLVGVDWEDSGIAAARVLDVVLAAAKRALHPGIDQIEGQRRVHADAGV